MKTEAQLWEERFGTPDYVYGTEPSVFLTEEAHRLPHGARILAIADGEGRNGVWLAEQGHHVVSVDRSEAALNKARRLADTRGIALDLLTADLETLPWPTTGFDAVVAIFTQYSRGPAKSVFFDQLKRSVVPGGLILLQGYSPKQLEYGTGGPKDIEHLYGRDEIASAFSDCEIISLAEHDRQLNEGELHNGPSALIELIARTQPINSRKESP